MIHSIEREVQEQINLPQGENSMSGGQIGDLEAEVEFDLGKSITLVDVDSDSAPIEKVRTAVNVTREAVHAISITALETLREGAVFMGVIGSRGELLNPFTHIDAALSLIHI